MLPCRRRRSLADEHASLWKVIYYAHGTAAKIEGPYDWSSPNISSTAINPAALVFTDPTTGKLVYSLWIGGDILVAASAAGPYVKTYRNPAGSNTAPAFSDGFIYVTSQATTTVVRATSLAGPWSHFATIPHPKLSYTVEDPYMFVDRNKNFHVINHACEYPRQSTRRSSEEPTSPNSLMLALAPLPRSSAAPHPPSTPAMPGAWLLS